MRPTRAGARAVLSIGGVCGLLSFGDHPAKVPDFVVEDIRGREVDGLIPVPPPEVKSFPFKAGDSVVVSSELMGDISALFVCRQGPGRVRILMQLMGKWHKATVPLGSIHDATS